MMNIIGKALLSNIGREQERKRKEEKRKRERKGRVGPGPGLVRSNPGHTWT